VIVPIVEGHAERESVPLFIRRLLHDQQVFDLPVRQGIRVPRDQLLKRHELERKVEYARRQDGAQAVVILVDADDDCPRDVAIDARRRGEPVAAGMPVSVVLAKTEIEAWFIAGIESLRGFQGIGHDAASPADPEDIRDAKGWLSRHMVTGRTYVPAHNQASMAARVDYQLAATRSRSLRKFIKDVTQIADRLRS